MARNYAALTGKKIVKRVRSKHLQTTVVCVLGLGFCILIVCGMIRLVRENHEYITPVFGMVLAALGGWYAVYQFIRQMKVLRDVPNARVFRKYGTPDEIARTISEESGSSLLESGQTLLTPSFIMKHGDYESFMPSKDIVLMYRKEHRTNGVLDSVFLVCHDQYGDKFDYPFKLGKKHAGKMDFAVGEIVKHCPECRFGYTQENIRFVSQNAKPLN
ncbi:MAG TPA: hypothetical protein DDX71_01110 [Ruminococcus sp.]|nr:hypothetical protein [Ruminococcus sp.]